MPELRDKRAKFVDLAEARTSRAMHTIRLIGNLASRSNYEYSDADVQKIVRALEIEVRDLRSRFQSSDSRSRPEFKL
jgi:hypothetical protein